MAYAIMRFEKFKATNIASLPGSLSHTFRSRYTPNAAKEKVKDNRVLLGPTDHREVAEAVRARWPERFRKDAIGFIELFIGASIFPASHPVVEGLLRCGERDLGGPAQ